MKKQPKKLVLAKETLLQLEGVKGGSEVTFTWGGTTCLLCPLGESQGYGGGC
jgi:hypothetical protein